MYYQFQIDYIDCSIKILQAYDRLRGICDPVIGGSLVCGDK